MDTISRFILRFPIILASALLLLGTIIAWHIFGEFRVTNIYYLLNITYLVCVLLLITGAMKYQNDKMRSAVLLSSASLLLILTLNDFYLVTFCYDTSGPGGANVITHCHWFNKFVTKNEYGFWDRSLSRYENPVDKRKELVIAVVGDSFTWGQGLKGKSLRLTEQLEKRLNARSGVKQVTVLNFGKGGADTIQEKQITDEFVSKIHPDIVVVCYITNDIYSDSNDYSDFGERISTISPTVNLIYWRLIGPAKYQDIGLRYLKGLVALYNDKESFNKHMDDLSQLFQDIKKMEAQPIFVLLPFPHMWKIFPKETGDNIYNRIKEAVAKSGIPVIDLSYIEEKYTLAEFQVSSFDGHPNEKMHAEFAEAIYQWLVNKAEFVNLSNDNQDTGAPPASPSGLPPASR
jgi:lysophospholipase L1-like esterase